MKPLETIHQRNADRATWVMIVITLLAMLIGGTGCYTERTAQRQVDKAWHKFPLIPTQFCADHFRCLDSIHETTKYIQGEDLVIVDTVDRVEQHFDTVIIYKTITKTVKQVDTFYTGRHEKQTDKAPVKAAEIKERETSDNNIKLTTSRNTWRNWAIAGWSLIALLVLWNIVRTYLRSRTI